jgi:hypothetical protein
MGESLVIRLARIEDATGLAQAEKEIAAEPGLRVSQPGEISESAYVQKFGLQKLFNKRSHFSAAN